MEFFIGNPFSTPVGQLIEHATSSSLPSEDWGLNMEICDIVNETEDGPKDAVRAIKKRILGNRNFKEVMLALSVLEACVKNCGHKFHVYISTRDFVENVLVQTLLPKNNPPMILQDRVLSMIQAWSDAFRSCPDLTGVVTVYEDLRRKGVEFPMTELNGYSPIHTPERSIDTMSPVTAHAEQHSVKATQPQNTETTLTLSPQQSKQLKAELEVVQNNLSVMSDMMSQMEPGSVQQSDTELLQQLYSMCKDMQGRMVDLIPRLTDEKLTEHLLMVNDDMNTTFAQYHRFERHLNRQSNAESSPAYANLIDLGAALESPNQSKAAYTAHSAISQSTVNTLSNQMAGLSTKEDDFKVNKSSSLQKSPENSSALGGLATTLRKQQDIGAIPVDQSEVMDDIEQWLDVDDEDDSEGVTSEEFDKFLAERAKAADRLPSVTTSPHDPSRSQP
ncbi:target of Myb1 membrane trafficking protein-like isoform X2 [Myxocyprinus asiaticus]|uniref:target of Myb1 membrane trafficking protein-like isoform X2 n=1 Tax=Myxocyprinus asiaticus TaxID=70543 RepID=UPI002223A58C|nr:target of Myb1 membrane trafficking protein-like isoform X2 [Myxocyprinus asiaticus]